MKWRLQELNRVPYGGGYEVVDPITGVAVYGTTFKMLMNRVFEERKANGAPIGLDIENEVEGWVCAKYSNECEPADASLPGKRGLTLGDVVRGTRVLLSFKLAGSPLVPAEEAERRAKICAGCRYNVQFPMPCAGLCGELLSAVQAIIGNNATPTNNSSKSCAICKCYTGAHVWMPLEILKKGLDKDMEKAFSMIDWCWKKTT